jgi:hypothetical protein
MTTPKPEAPKPQENNRSGIGGLELNPITMLISVTAFIVSIVTIFARHC